MNLPIDWREERDPSHSSFKNLILIVELFLLEEKCTSWLFLNLSTCSFEWVFSIKWIIFSSFHSLISSTSTSSEERRSKHCHGCMRNQLKQNNWDPIHSPHQFSPFSHTNFRLDVHVLHDSFPHEEQSCGKVDGLLKRIFLLRILPARNRKHLIKSTVVAHLPFSSLVSSISPVLYSQWEYLSREVRIEWPRG